MSTNDYVTRKAAIVAKLRNATMEAENGNFNVAADLAMHAATDSINLFADLVEQEIKEASNVIR